MIAADGRVVWLQDRVTVHVVDGRPETLRGVMVDITDRKRAEAALRESEERFRALADTAPMMVWASNVLGQPDFINQRWIAFFGRELHEVSPDGWYDFLHPDDRQIWATVFLRALEKRQPFEIDARSRRADGEYRWVTTHGVPRVDASGAFAGYIGTAIDITERRRAEETRQRLETQLRQSQKMEAMGTLAGGIAHDFNNLLAAIGGNLELASMDLGTGHPVQENLDEMRRAVHRATELVQRILTFSRPEIHEQQPTQLGPVVGEAVRMLRALIPAGIRLSHVVAPDLPDVMANASQVHQMLVNLATNAWQAMDGGSGHIDVRLETCNVEPALCDTHADLRPGPHLCLSVADSGHGMAPATLERIFEPFFTTKEPGKGTGLGSVDGARHRPRPRRRGARRERAAAWLDVQGPVAGRREYRPRRVGCEGVPARLYVATASGSFISTTSYRWSSWRPVPRTPRLPGPGLHQRRGGAGGVPAPA